MKTNSTSYRQKRTVCVVAALLLVGFVLTGNVFYRTEALESAIVDKSFRQTSAECFKSGGQALTLISTPKGWILNTTLQLVNPGLDIENEKFTASWKIDLDKQPIILHDQITHEPPLRLHFYFDIENQVTYPQDENQAKEDSEFWSQLFQEIVLPSIEIDQLSTNVATVYCNCYCEDTPLDYPIVDFDEGESTQLSNAIYNKMVKAVKCSNTEKNSGSFRIEAPNQGENANLWVIFRWHLEDKQMLEKKQCIDSDFNEWSKRILERYPIKEFVRPDSCNQILIVVLGRSETSDSWKYFREKIEKREGVWMSYLQISDISDGSKDFIQRRLETPNIMIPISLPLALAEDQVDEMKLSINYPDCNPVSISIKYRNPGGANSALSFLDAAIYGGLFISAFELALFLGLLFYRYNPPIYRLRTNLKAVVSMPWEPYEQNSSR